jgi:hypothetical protein
LYLFLWEFPVWFMYPFLHWDVDSLEVEFKRQPQNGRQSSPATHPIRDWSDLKVKAIGLKSPPTHHRMHQPYQPPGGTNPNCAHKINKL